MRLATITIALRGASKGGGTLYWTGHNWSAEYPDAKLYGSIAEASTVTATIRTHYASQNIKGTLVIILDEGFDNVKELEP